MDEIEQRAEAAREVAERALRRVHDALNEIGRARRGRSPERDSLNASVSPSALFRGAGPPIVYSAR